MVKFRYSFMALLVLGAGLFLDGFSCHPKPQGDLPVVTLKAGGQKIWAEVANKESTRDAGLMFRQEMDWNNGMLFVFPDSKIRAFWMKNTLIPLSIAYMDDKGTILNVEEMQPQNEESIWSKGPAKYALEMNGGWYTKEGVKAGDVVEGVLSAPKADEQ
jgi:uncharacterized protein